MKLGFVSAILDGWTFEEMIDTASEMGFSCVEVVCCAAESVPALGSVKPNAPTFAPSLGSISGRSHFSFCSGVPNA